MAKVIALLLLSVAVNAQDKEADVVTPEETEAVVETPSAGTPEQPKTMSGMSILGNEEAPKALVIIPWKSSELGDDLSLSGNRDDQAEAVDKDVFLRELRFYEIRKAE